MTARLRLLLAILLLALAPVMAPATAGTHAVPAAASLSSSAPHCVLPCDGVVLGASAHAACPCASHLPLAPLPAMAGVSPGVSGLVVAAAAATTLTPALWPPPLPPPRS